MSTESIRFALLVFVIILSVGGVAMASVAVYQSFGDLLWVVKRSRSESQRLYVWTMTVALIFFAAGALSIALIIGSSIRNPTLQTAAASQPGAVERAWLFVLAMVAFDVCIAILLWAWNRIRPKAGTPHVFLEGGPK